MWAAAKGTQRLNTLVKSLLLRRTKEQTSSEGRPLVSLPAKRVVSHRLQLSARERLVHDVSSTVPLSLFKTCIKFVTFLICYCTFQSFLDKICTGLVKSVVPSCRGTSLWQCVLYVRSQWLYMYSS